MELNIPTIILAVLGLPVAGAIVTHILGRKKNDAELIEKYVKITGDVISDMNDLTGQLKTLRASLDAAENLSASLEKDNKKLSLQSADDIGKLTREFAEEKAIFRQKVIKLVTAMSKLVEEAAEYPEYQEARMQAVAILETLHRLRDELTPTSEKVMHVKVLNEKEVVEKV